MVPCALASCPAEKLPDVDVAMQWEHAVYYAMNTLFFPAVVIAVELLRWINS